MEPFKIWILQFIQSKGRQNVRVNANKTYVSKKFITLKDHKKSLFIDDDDFKKWLNKKYNDYLLYQDIYNQYKGVELTVKQKGELRRLLYNINNICYLCNHGISKFEKCNIDHVIPKSKGGLNVIENMKLTHIDCNEEKGSSDLEEFLKEYENQ